MISYNLLPDFLLDESGRKVKAEEWPNRREAIRQLLQEQEYGCFPPAPDSLSFISLEKSEDYCAGKAAYEKLLAKGSINGKAFSFPFFAVVPTGVTAPPAFLHINFRNLVPDEYMPTEELIDGGFAVFSFGYNDVTTDDGDFTNGLAPLFPRNETTSPGKIALWAWAAMRVMDYICSRQDIDTENVAVIGHSRLGKTALLAGAMDERFKYVISNESGCSGAAITRDKEGERVADITKNFPYWFCGNYRKFCGQEALMPFDQHYLLALTAPRFLYVASAEGDAWAGPGSEWEGCRQASGAWELLGYPGFVPGGRIGYHIRKGTHYLSRFDWQKFMAFINAH